ncbi:unnamed protein product [Caenorhabditis angaria]|uniref:Uncharacterized protein n=1 Tax=Caenorhabditis angaria TaxID=860376 RepID=A0A9P1IST4_9PELO|nr:unnamed protein product [Caenorhabditis angaria]
MCPPRFLQSFENPNYIRSLHMAFGTISLLLTSFTIFMICKVKNRRIRGVKYVLLQHQIFALFTNFMLCFLLCPYFFIPSVAIGSLGFLEILGVNFKAQCYFGQVIFDSLAICIVAIFENRHSAVTTIKFKLHTKSARRIWYAVNYIVAFAIFSPYIFDDCDNDEAKLEILKTAIGCPNEIFFSSITHVLTLRVRIPAFSMCFCLLIIGSQSLFFLLHTVFHLLYSNDQKISENTRKLQQKFLRTICIQIAVPFLSVGLPLLIVTCAVFMNFHNQLLSAYCCVLLGAYPSIFSILLILLHPVYRDFTRNLVFCRGDKKVMIIVANSL